MRNLNQKQTKKKKRLAKGNDPWTFKEWCKKAEAQAYSSLQLKPWEFWRLTPGEYLLILKGFNERFELELKLRHQEMDLHRWVGWMVYSVHSKKRKTRQQLFPLPGDKDNKKDKPPKLTKDKFLSLVNQLENPDKSWQSQ